MGNGKLQTAKYHVTTVLPSRLRFAVHVLTAEEGILYFADWTGLDWTGIVKRGLVKRGLVKRGLVKRGLVKRGLVKRKENVGFINTIIYYSKNFSSENKRYHNS